MLSLSPISSSPISSFSSASKIIILFDLAHWAITFPSFVGIAYELSESDGIWVTVDKPEEIWTSVTTAGETWTSISNQC